MPRATWLLQAMLTNLVTTELSLFSPIYAAAGDAHEPATIEIGCTHLN